MKEILVAVVIAMTLVFHAESQGGDMELEFARVCFEMGGFMDDDGYCDMEDADVRLLRDLNITK